MPRARNTLISLDDTPYYHCMGRCVRRAFLWGQDTFSGKDYSHRKQWVIDRLKILSEAFTIEVCAYAVMSNHYHVVLYVDKQKADTLSNNEVIARWSRLFSIPVIVQRYVNKDAISHAEQAKALEIIQTWRARLYNISWFMRCLNEYLAREANKEDNCTGRFWEGRYQSQALLDEAGLLTCMAYVDLNPVRAKMAPTPEASDFTSIQQHIHTVQQQTEPTSNRVPLKSFRLPSEPDEYRTLPFSFTDYLNLVDWTGSVIRENKRGAIDTTLPPILVRLNINADIWQQLMQPHGNVFKCAIGRVDTLRLYAQHQQQSWCQGVQASRQLFLN